MYGMRNRRVTTTCVICINFVNDLSIFFIPFYVISIITLVQDNRKDPNHVCIVYPVVRNKHT